MTFNVMKKYLSFVILFISSLFFLSSDLYSQEKTLISPYIQLQYFKNSDDQRMLKTTLTYSLNRMELPLAGLGVTFYSGGNKKEIIGTAVTDVNGVAGLPLDNKLKLSTDAKGMWSFSAGFTGNDTIEAGTADVTVKDVILEASFTEQDSIKTITVKAKTIDNGKEVAVSGESVLVYVPRMFSLLQLGEVSLDATGTGSLEFPRDLPGDKDGKITIITKFEEHATFGNVEKRKELNWGVPTVYSAPSAHRALWTKTAPRWMIYTLSILLAGVWGHYLFAIISLIRIRIEAKKREELDNYGK
jgi:hypothetical protein